MERIKRHLIALTKSTSFMLTMSHVCSLEQKIDYNNDTPPNNVADWDRKTWSAQNYFSTPGVSVDVGSFILGTMFLAIRHALGMESPMDQHRQNEIDTAGSRRLAPWDCEPCIMHPIVSGSATTGGKEARVRIARPSPTCPVATSNQQNAYESSSRP